MLLPQLLMLFRHTLFCSQYNCQARLNYNEICIILEGGLEWLKMTQITSVVMKLITVMLIQYVYYVAHYNSLVAYNHICRFPLA